MISIPSESKVEFYQCTNNGCLKITRASNSTSTSTSNSSTSTTTTAMCHYHSGTIVMNNNNQYNWSCCPDKIVKSLNQTFVIKGCCVSHVHKWEQNNSIQESGIAAKSLEMQMALMNHTDHQYTTPLTDWTQLRVSLEETNPKSMGYPVNAGNYDYSSLFDFFKYNIINVGDSFDGSLYKTNTKEIERQVLEFFAHIWGSDFEHLWGYITQAGTEGNLQGLYVGREYAKSLGKTPIFYTTKNSHYSIFKIAKLLQLDMCLVNSQDNGEMDYKHLEECVSKNIDKFALISCTIGTTMRGAIDDSREIYRIIKKLGKQDDFYLHADGALSGIFLPFLEADVFFTAHINSISVSGHKFLGIPFPCGLFLMEKRFVSCVSSSIEYIGATDCMISGSRNGHAALFMKLAIEKKGKMGFARDIKHCISMAEYLSDRVPRAWRNQNSITVCIPKPSVKTIKRFQLATEGDISHVICMQHVTRGMVDELIEALREDEVVGPMFA